MVLQRRTSEGFGDESETNTYKKAIYNNIALLYSPNGCYYNGLFVPVSVQKLCITDRIYFEKGDGRIYVTQNMEELQDKFPGKLVGATEKSVIVSDKCIGIIRNGIRKNLLFFWNNEILQCENEKEGSIERFFYLPKDTARGFIMPNELLIKIFEQYLVVGYKNSILFIDSTSLTIPPISHTILDCILSFEELKVCNLKLLGVRSETRLSLFHSTNLVAELHPHVRLSTLYEKLSMIEKSIFGSISESEQIQLLFNPLYVITSQERLLDVLQEAIHKAKRPSVFAAVLREDPKYGFCYSRLHLVYKEEYKDKKNFLDKKYKRLFWYSPNIRNSKNLAYWVISKEKKVIKAQRMAKTIEPNVKVIKRVLKSILKDNRGEEVLNILTESEIRITKEVCDTESIRRKAFLCRVSASTGLLFLNANEIKGLQRPSLCINGSSICEKLDDGLLFMVGIGYGSFASNSDGEGAFELGMLFGHSLRFGLSDEAFRKCVKYLQYLEDERYIPFILPVLATRNRVLYYPREWPPGSLNQVFLFYLHSSDSKSLSMRKAAIAALGIYNLGSSNKAIHTWLIKEAQRTGPFDKVKNSEFYDKKYRIIAAVCASLVCNIKSPVSLSDSFCSLLINGLCAIGTGTTRFSLYRDSSCRVEEIFYSELFTLTSRMEMKAEDAVAYVEERLEGLIQLGDKTELSHRLAAFIFYASLKSLAFPSTLMSSDIVRKKFHFYSAFGSFSVKHPSDTLLSTRILKIALSLEEASANNDPGVLFLYSLISLSIIRHGSFDLSLIRVLRRRILLSHGIAMCEPFSEFSTQTKSVENSYPPTYQTLLLLKIALGLVSSGFGLMKFHNSSETYKLLIVTFFLPMSNRLEYDPFDILRTLSVGQLYSDKNDEKRFQNLLHDIKNKIASKKMMKIFERNASELSPLDKKFLYDILSDYYENYHYKESLDVLFDMKHLAHAMSSLE